MSPGSPANRTVRAAFRATGKAFLWLFAVLAAILLPWFAAIRLLDEAPDPQRDAFLASSADRIPDERNAAIGILGLTAPPGVDFVQHGSRVKALNDAGAPWARIQDLLRGPKALTLTVDIGRLSCWLDPDDPVYKGRKGCLPFAEAPRVLNENGELLRRYKALYRMGTYANLEIASSQTYLAMLRLSVAEIHLGLRRRDHAAAYRLWRDQLRFARRNLRGPDTWVGKAVGLVAFGFSFAPIENLLLANPRLASDRRAELLELLRPEGMQAFDPDGIVRAEYALLLNALKRSPREAADWPQDRLHWLAFHFAQRNRLLNRYHAFARDYAQALRLPWNEVEAATKRLREEHVLASDRDLLLDPFGSLFLGRYIDGQLRAREMLRQMHIVDGQLRLATLLVRILDERIGDDDIPAFLASAGAGYHDPLSGKPMQWSAKQRKIYLPDPEQRCAMYASLRVPARPRSAKASPPSVQAGSC